MLAIIFQTLYDISRAYLIANECDSRIIFPLQRI